MADIVPGDKGALTAPQAMGGPNSPHDPTSLRRSRWWLDPALARVAFSTSTGGCNDDGHRSPWAPCEDGSLRIDLADPAQRDFGDYELLEQIGQGGTGIVFRARQRSLDREVAIKLLAAGLQAPEDLIDNLRREAHHAAVLQHPHVVIVHEMGEYAGLIYYAMQLVPGRSLSQRLQAEGRFSPSRAATVLQALAEAVDYAHRLGVLHLDLKPGNILIDERGEPLIADFGLARQLQQSLDHARMGGTPSYMAPEQACRNGPPLTQATDIWALGIVLYEMVTGQPPFEGPDPIEVLRSLREHAVPLPSTLVRIPPDLEAICLKCLAKDPAQRYPGARALADDLGRFLDRRPVTARPINGFLRLARWARREPVPAGAIVLIFALLLGALVATTLLWR